jgi:hypothetical protein
MISTAVTETNRVREMLAFVDSGTATWFVWAPGNVSEYGQVMQ